MHVALITPTPPDISAFGMRSISAVLKQAGHRVTLIFLPGGIEQHTVSGERVYQYPDHLMDRIVQICRDTDMVGVSFMTNYFDRAVQVTQTVKSRLKVPVIWGGTHPTVKPDEGLDFADFVCMGEGEEVLLELLQAMEEARDYRKIANLWMRENGREIKNPPRPLITDLDALPIFDFGLDGHFVFNPEVDDIVSMDEALFAKIVPVMPHRHGKFIPVYRTMASRGCPHHCTYCANAYFKKIYPAGNYYRRRSNESVVKEIREITRRYPFIKAVHFFDDTLFSTTVSRLEQFCDLYKREVGLPFYCQGSPATIDKQKVEIMIQAGMIFMEMGIQSGSEKICQLYRRGSTNEMILRAAGIIHDFRHQLFTPDYHVILDNPWESVDDTMETLKLILNLPGRFGLCLASLTFYPGTALYERALKEGRIRDEINEVYRKAFYKPRSTYLNFLISLKSYPVVPRWPLKLLSAKILVSMLHRRSLEPLYGPGMRFLEAVRIICKGIQALFTGDWRRIFLFFKRER